jgi:predicted exporter
MPDKRYLVFLAWGLFFVLVFYQVLAHTSIRSDMSAFLPAGANKEQRLLLQGLHQGPAARIWLMALEGETPEVLAAVSKDFAFRLRESDQFLQVLNGEELLDQATRDQLFKWRYLLSPRVDKEYFSVLSLKKALMDRLDDLGSPLSSFEKELIPSDPTAAFIDLMLALGSLDRGPEYFNGVWFSEDRKQALLLVDTRAEGMDLDAQQRAYDTILRQFNKAREGAAIRLIASGAPLFALESRSQIRQESQRLSLMATLFMLLFMGWVYRSPRRLLMTALPLAGGILAAIASVSLLFDSVHGITLAFGITLMGVAVDYPVHVLSHVHRGEGLSQAVDRIWPTLRLGVLTTLMGYAAMSMTEFTGLAQLGVFSMAGLLVAALITRSLLPAIRDTQDQPLPSLMSVIGYLDVTPPLIVRLSLLVAVIVVLALVARQGDSWSDDIAELSPLASELRDQDRQLRAQMQAPEPRYLLMLSAESTNELLLKLEALESPLDRAVGMGYLAGFQSAAKIIPSVTTQRQRQAALPEAEVLSQRLDEALLDLPFRHALFEPFLAAVEQAKTLEPLELKDLEQGSLGIRLAGLVRPVDNQVVGLVQLSQVEHPLRMEEVMAEADVQGLRFIDLKRATNQIVDTFRLEAIDRILWASVLIVLILMFGLRDPVRGLRVLLPIILAVGLAASVPILTGHRLNLFHLVSLLLVAGIGLDYALFFSRSDSGKERLRTLHALVVCSTSTLVVFAMLAASSIPVLQAIGMTVTSGVLSAFILSWIFARRNNQTGFL